MKKITLFVVVLLSLAYKGNAQQLAASVLNNFDKGVALQVFDLVAKTNLSDENQVEAAELIRDRDSLMYVMLQQGRSATEILTTKSQFDDQIAALLSAEQKYNRYVKTQKENAKDKYSYSQFAIGIRYKDTLDLSPMQVTTIMAYIDSLKQMKSQYYATAKRSLDTRAFESAHLAEILTNQQYGQLLIYKNKGKAGFFAEQDWVEVHERGLDSIYTKEVAVKDLFDYYLIREAISNRFQHDPIKQKAEMREIYATRPQVLRSLEKARRSPQNNTAGSGYGW